MLKSMISKKQRAFVLQGGGALGAYEAGVFKVLYHWINNQIGEDENIFDVIAGTSAGVINGALLLNHVPDNKRRNPSIKLPNKAGPNHLKLSGISGWTARPQQQQIIRNLSIGGISLTVSPKCRSQLNLPEDTIQLRNYYLLEQGTCFLHQSTSYQTTDILIIWLFPSIMDGTDIPINR